MNRIIILTLTILFIFSLSAFAAAPKKFSYQYPWYIRSVKALGMGDAYYTKSDDRYAPFYNPAGLARITKNTFAFSVTGDINKDTYDFIKDYNKTDTDKNDEVAKLLNDYIGKQLATDAQVYISYSRPNFVFGVYGIAKINATVNNPILPELITDSFADVGLVTGIGLSFLDEDKLQTGISVKGLYRNSLERTFTLMDIVDGQLDDYKADDDLKNAFGVFADLGIIYNFYMDGLNPRVGVAVNNLGTNSMGSAKDLPYSVNLSAGISPGYGIITSDLIIDLRDVTQNFDEDKSWGKRVNLGVEIRFWDVFALRGGLHQGYFTFGAGVNLFDYFELNYAHYYEEAGTYPGQLKNERHALELILGF